MTKFVKVSLENSCVSAADLGKACGVSERRICQIQEERPDLIVKISHGKFDLLKSLEGFRAYQATKKVNGNSPDVSTDAGTEYEKQRARLTRAKADMVEMELALREGRLHDADIIKKVWGDMVTNSKTRLLSVPVSCAGAMDGMSIAERQEFMKEKIVEACDELKDYNPDALSGSELFADMPEIEDGSEEDGEDDFADFPEDENEEDAEPEQPAE